MSDCCRPGFTRASLLVVAVIGLVLLGLLVPAIQKVREAAACVECANNLKLVTLATHNANDTYGFVPSNPDTVGDRYGTTQDHLQPFLEWSSGYKEGSSYYHTTLRAFRCPSDPTETGDPFYGPSNYATNNLLLQRRVRLRPEDFPGGLGQTVLFAEKYAACSYWALAEGEQAPWYIPSPTSGFQTRPERCDSALPQTPHRAGIQVSFADCSVRVTAPAVSPVAWHAAHARAKGECSGDE